MPQKECEDLVLQAVTQVTNAPHFHSHYFGTLFYHLFPGNQERRQLRRMLQDGDYHQGQNQLISALLVGRKINKSSSTFNLHSTGWGGEEAVAEQRAAHQVLGGEMSHRGPSRGTTSPYNM